LGTAAGSVCSGSSLRGIDAKVLTHNACYHGIKCTIQATRKSVDTTSRLVSDFFAASLRLVFISGILGVLLFVKTIVVTPKNS
jgi:hypothetical protein